MQTHIGTTEVTRYADEVSLLRSTSIYDVFLVCLTDTGDADGKSGIGRCGVTTYDINTPFVASHTESFVKLINVFYLETLTQCQTYNHLSWSSVHGKDIADVHHCTFISKVL